MGAVDALKGIHEIGVYNALISFILVIILFIAVVNALFAVLSILGIVTDPTTAGVTDSEQALTYTEPKE